MMVVTIWRRRSRRDSRSAFFFPGLRTRSRCPGGSIVVHYTARARLGLVGAPWIGGAFVGLPLASITRKASRSKSACTRVGAKRSMWFGGDHGQTLAVVEQREHRLRRHAARLSFAS